MKLVSWCKPPQSSYCIPKIPSSYKIFGITYQENNTEFISKELIKESYNKYLQLLNTSDLKLIEDIENIHLKINEILNKNKDKEVLSKLRKLKNETIRKKNNILTKLSRL